MRDLFESGSEADIISFYGKHPEGEEISIEKNGLLYGMLSGMLKERSDMIPVLRSYDARDYNVSSSFIHAPTKSFLNYNSIGTHRGVWYDCEDIYYEKLSVESACSFEELLEKMKDLEFLRENFMDLVKKNTSRVPSRERVKKMWEIKNELRQNSIY